MYELRIKNVDNTEKAVPLKGGKLEAINEAHIHYAPGLLFGGRVVDRESGETVHEFRPAERGKKRASTDAEVADALRVENEHLKGELLKARNTIAALEARLAQSQPAEPQL